MIPNRDKAYVPKKKLSRYLLSETHAVGKAKARHFRSLGYSEENEDRLANDLLMIAKSGQSSQEISFSYGTKYIVDGELVTPNGRKAWLRTVWVVESHDERPRFVTAYPAPKAIS